MMIKFPYGLSDFYELITENYFYVDRTAHIRTIEDFGRQLIFLRPHRFGKSLLLSMLENYYDIAKADEFERLFGHLAIGKNPTPKRNQYLVMTWDFSKVEAQGDSITIKNALYDHINNAMKRFAIRYDKWLQHEIEIKPENAISSFESLLTAVEQSGYRLYLLIDEYDNFVNELMIEPHKESPSRLDTLLSNECTVRTLFKAIKCGSGQGLERVFITGVSPIIDVSGGCEVGEHIYLRPEFNDLCGFLEAEIVSVLTQIVKECDYPEPEEEIQLALERVRTLYHGYCFSPISQELLYHPTLAFYFLKYWQQNCQSPRSSLDGNLRIERRKLSYISDLPGGEGIIIQAINRYPLLAIEGLVHGFGVQEMLDAPKDVTFIISLLYFFGILTLAGKNDERELLFKIPNSAFLKLYIEQLRVLLFPDPADRHQLRLLAKQFYKTGDLQPLVEVAEKDCFKRFDNRDNP